MRWTPWTVTWFTLSSGEKTDYVNWLVEDCSIDAGCENSDWKQLPRHVFKCTPAQYASIRTWFPVWLIVLVLGQLVVKCIMGKQTIFVLLTDFTCIDYRLWLVWFWTPLSLSPLLSHPPPPPPYISGLVRLLTLTAMQWMTNVYKDKNDSCSGTENRVASLM